MKIFEDNNGFGSDILFTQGKSARLDLRIGEPYRWNDIYTEWEEIFDGYEDEEIGVISNLWVIENKRNKKIGSKLVNAAINKLRDMGIKACFLRAVPTTDDKRESLHRFYARNGFNDMGIEDESGHAYFKLVIPPAGSPPTTIRFGTLSKLPRHDHSNDDLALPHTY